MASSDEPKITLFNMDKSTMLTDYVTSPRQSNDDEKDNAPDSPIISSVPIIAENQQYNVYDERLKKMESQMEIMMKCIAELQTSMKHITNKLNENSLAEEKGNDIEILRKEIGNIKSKLNDKGIMQNKNELKQWLVNIVQLPEYYDVFIYNGIEDLQTVKLLTISTLKQMGIDKIGHQMKILHKVQELNQKQPQIHDKSVNKLKSVEYAEGNMLIETKR